MKTSSPGSTPQNPRSILLMGPPGARKTSLVLGFPGLYIIDCDQNLAGPDRAIRLSNPTLSYNYDTVGVDDSGKPVPAYDCFDRTMDLMSAAAKSDAQWVCIDGLTAINYYITEKIMKQQNITALEARNWSTFRTDASKLLWVRAREIKKNLIITAHEEEETRTDPKNIMVKITTGYVPFIQSGVQQQLGGFFTDVWRLEANLAPGDKIETTLTTDKVGLMKQLKNSVGLPHTIKNPTYADLHKLSGGLL